MATKNEQINFIKTLYPAALSLYERGGIHPLFVVAQAGVETGWKIKGTGNNIFGITKGSTWKGKVQLYLTTEYFKAENVKFKEPERIVSIEKLNENKYRYKVYRYFRVYDSLSDCLDDHLALLKKSMYADAWPYRDDPREYARILVDDTGAKYATATNYASVLISSINSVEKIAKEHSLCGNK